MAQIFNLFVLIEAPRPPFVYFRPFLNAMTDMLQNMTINGKSIDGVLGIQTWDCRMVCACKSTEL